MRTKIEGGMTPAQYYTGTNTNFKKSYLGANWFNVEDYGAVHNNSTDDTAAIQDAINACHAAGGGTVYFPCGIYVISGVLQNNIGTYSLDYNSQLYIPSYDYLTSTNLQTIRLLGETVPSHIQNGFLIKSSNGAILKSTIAGTGDWPSVISTLGRFGTAGNYNDVVIENLTVRVNPFVATTGPSMCGVNLIWCAHSKIINLFVGLDLQDFLTCIVPENHVFGLAVGVVNGDFCIINNYTCFGGFYYGLVCWEGVHVNQVQCYCCYIGITFLGSGYRSLVNYAVLHWNAYDIASAQENFYTNIPSTAYVSILNMSSEDNYTGGPWWFDRVDEILDTSNLLVGELTYNLAGSGLGPAAYIEKGHGGRNLIAKNGCTSSNFSWTTATRPTALGYGCTGWNETTSKLECWNGATWSDLF
jgi:hypothetical protein